MCGSGTIKRHGDGGGVVVQLGFRRKEKIWMCSSSERCKRKYSRVCRGQGAAEIETRKDPAGGLGVVGCSGSYLRGNVQREIRVLQRVPHCYPMSRIKSKKFPNEIQKLPVDVVRGWYNVLH